MRPDTIRIRGAREHNLRGVDLDIPRGAITTITGVSGSGKSSLALDTIHREGQRRFLQSLSPFARQFLGPLERPRVDRIEGLGPSLAIARSSARRSWRSTVATLTEISDPLRVLFARLGTLHCPDCGHEVRSQTADQIAERILSRSRPGRVVLLAPVVRGRKGEHRALLEELRLKGFTRVIVDGEERRLDEPLSLDRRRVHHVDLVVDRVSLAASHGAGAAQETAAAEEIRRIRSAVETSLRLAEGLVRVRRNEEEDVLHSSRRACPACGRSLPEPEPRMFSFNSPEGACPSCRGLGQELVADAARIVPDPAWALGRISREVVEPIERHLRGVWRRWGGVLGRLGLEAGRAWESLDETAQEVLLKGEHPEKDGASQVRARDRGGKGVAALHASDVFRKPGWPGLLPLVEALPSVAPGSRFARLHVPRPCSTCKGQRLRPESLAVRFHDRGIAPLLAASVEATGAFFGGLHLEGREAEVGRELLAELQSKLAFLVRVGLGYLSLDRAAPTLAGGELQRLRLAASLGADLQGVVYVLDEPSVGLHARDHGRLLETLRRLRDRGNTLVVVEHDRETMLASDMLVDLGPGAGREGGTLVAAGTPCEVARNPRSRTARYLRNEGPSSRSPRPDRPAPEHWLRIRKAHKHNLRDLDVALPLGRLVAVTGVSGSGKSSLVDGVLRPEVERRLGVRRRVIGERAASRGLEGLEGITKLVVVDQSPIGRNARSNPATYTGVLDEIRRLFAQVPEARARGYRPGRFSFNVRGGRCEACEGAGVREVAMQFLAPVEVTCETCGGSRFQKETLEILWGGRTIADVLALSAGEALEAFQAIPRLRRTLSILVEVGLGYLPLGQSARTLSAGEAQRIKLTTELSRPNPSPTLYLLDEPTVGLHADDVADLLHALNRLVDAGHTVIIVEHNLDVVARCDWVVDLGPEGGRGGGRLVAEGPPEAIEACEASWTGRFLRARSADHAPHSVPGTGTHDRGRAPRAGPRAIRVHGARTHNLHDIDVTIPWGTLALVTGPSGSGKSSLAFDTLYAEGRRRFLDALSPYARRFLERIERPPVDRIEGLAPAISVDAGSGTRTPRSTLSTATEIQDHLRILFARLGKPYCPACDRALAAEGASAAAARLAAARRGQRVSILAPLHRVALRGRLRLAAATDTAAIAPDLLAAGYLRLLVGGEEVRLDRGAPRVRDADRAVSLVIDRLVLQPRRQTRLAEALELALSEGHGFAVVEEENGGEEWISRRPSCATCGFVLEEPLTPRRFSFNASLGACPRCKGLGAALQAGAERVIVNPSRPLLQGALEPCVERFLDGSGGAPEAVFRTLAKAHRFDVDRPYEELSTTAKEILLWGSASGRSAREPTAWRGILGRLEDAAADGNLSGEGLLSGVVQRGECPACSGSRLEPVARNVRFSGSRMHEVCAMDVREARAWFASLHLEPSGARIAAQPLREIIERLALLEELGLGYLTLDREATTLSGGEARRARLATQLASGLSGVLFVLDEPTVGLHARDCAPLLAALRRLRDRDNTVVVVEHDLDFVRQADFVIDLGPGGGREGGRVLAVGSPGELAANPASPTGRALRAGPPPPFCHRREGAPPIRLELLGVTRHNLCGVDLRIPLGRCTAVTGVSGSGKSTLVAEVLPEALSLVLRGGPSSGPDWKGLRGWESLRRVVRVDQEPLAGGVGSNPATATGAFDRIRELFAALPESRKKGYGPERFSFHRPEGRCEACRGLGAQRIGMEYLADVWVRCEACRGRRYAAETLRVQWAGASIADVLDMEIHRAAQHFDADRRLRAILGALEDLGLGYLRLGQPASTLSAGEAQRVKLAAELAKSRGAAALYVLDEPTIGLHVTEVRRLLDILQRLVSRGDTVVVVEHHGEVLLAADHLVDLGPEGGPGGGRIVAEGVPTTIARAASTPTGEYLHGLVNERGCGRGSR